jgi:hypothetical protein
VSVATEERTYSRDPHIPSRFTAEERLREVHPALRKHLGKRVAPPLPVPAAPVWRPAEPQSPDAPAGEADDAPGVMRSVVCLSCGKPFKASRKALAQMERREAVRCLDRRGAGKQKRSMTS